MFGRCNDHSVLSVSDGETTSVLSVFDGETASVVSVFDSETTSEQSERVRVKVRYAIPIKFLKASSL